MLGQALRLEGGIDSTLFRRKLMNPQRVCQLQGIRLVHPVAACGRALYALKSRSLAVLMPASDKRAELPLRTHSSSPTAGKSGGTIEPSTRA